MADVICPNCAGSYHETTDQYSPDKKPNGSMFRLKETYREGGWDSFIEDDGTIEDNLSCPNCEGLYIIAGRINVIGWDDGLTPCPVCGERFKPSGLHFHMKAKHPDSLPNKQ